jgi:hypothetical protein
MEIEMKKILVFFLFCASVIGAQESIEVTSEEILLNADVKSTSRYEDKTGVLMPVGSVIAFMGPIDQIPAGWVLCDGRTIDLSANPEFGDLYTLIGNMYGNSPVGTFKVPDLRGMFLRGVDSRAVNDPERVDPDNEERTRADGITGPVVGSFQQHRFARHGHSVRMGNINSNSSYDVPFKGRGYDSAQSDEPAAQSGGDETRPVNIYVYYIIKY